MERQVLEPPSHTLYASLAVSGFSDRYMGWIYRGYIGVMEKLGFRAKTA